MEPRACEIQREYIQEKLDDALAPEAAVLLASHLEACAACRAYEQSLVRITRRLDAELAMPLAGPVPDLVQALDLESAPLLARAPVPTARRSRVLGWAVVAACALFAVGVSTTQLMKPAAAPSATVAATQPSPGTVRVAAANADMDDAQAILTWFGPEADPDTSW